MSEDLIFITNLPTYKKALYQAVADSCGIDVTFGPAKNFLIEANDHVSVWVAKKDNAERYADAVVELERYIIRFLKFILSGTQGNFIFDEKDYVSLLKFFKDLEITNQKISEYIYELKLRIKRLL